MTGEVDPYGEAKYERDIAGKAAQLTDRVQDLIDDVCLLYEGGFLHTDDGEHVFDPSAVTPRTQRLGLESHKKQPFVRDGTERTLELGRILSLLETDQDAIDLVWGILLGYLDTNSDQFSEKEYRIQHVIDELQFRHDQRLVSIGTEQFTGAGEEITEVREVTRETLREKGLGVETPILNVIVRHFFNSEDSSLPTQETDHSSIEGSIESEGIPHPDSPPETEGWTRSRIESLVEGIVSETEVTAIDSLHTDLRKDVHFLRNKTRYGTSVQDVVDEIPLEGSIKRSRFPTTSYSAMERLTSVLRKLSERGGFNSRYQRTYGSKWGPERPVTKESHGGNWQLTDYGRILCRSKRQRGDNTAWVYECILEDPPISEDEKKWVEHVISKEDVAES